MTISSDIRKAGPYSANGATVTFPFSFKCFSTADVQVVLTDASAVETVLTLTSQYTVALNADQNTSPGGSITTVATYASGNKITIVGDVDYQQNTDITNGGGFYPEVIESALDKVTMQVQQIKEQVDRSAKLPVSSTEDATALVADLIRVADSIVNVDTVAGNIANVNAVGSDIANVNAVAGNAANINAVAANAANINTVAANIADIDTVVANIADIDTVVANIVDIQNAQENAALVVNATSQAVDGEKDSFVAGVGYTKNVTTQLTLTYTPAKSGTVKVFFDGVYQNLTEWSLVGKVITFTAAILADQVEVTYEIPSQLVGLSNADLIVLGTAEANAQASVTTATNNATTAISARIAAESARDAALIQAGVYVDEPTGRAAVADGVAFKVQGSGDVAAYEYRRVNASTSTLIATYPSSAAIANMPVEFETLDQSLIADADVVLIDAQRKIIASFPDIVSAKTSEFETLDAGGEVPYIDADRKIVAHLQTRTSVSNTLAPITSRINKGLTPYGDILGPYANTWSMRDTRMRLRKLAAGDGGTSQYVIAFIGDSYTHGNYFTNVVAKALQTQYGFAGSGWTGFGGWFAGTGPWTAVNQPTGITGNVRPDIVSIVEVYGSWVTSSTGSNNTPSLESAASSTVGDYVRFTKSNGSTVVTLYYCGDGTGVVQVSWDDGVTYGANVSLSTVGAANVQLTGTPSNAVTARIKVVSGNVKLAGVNQWSYSPGVIVHKLGWSGSSTSSWTAADATLWANQLSALGCNAHVMMFGTNDQGQITPATFGSNLGILSARIRSILPYGDLMIAMPPENNRTTNPYPMTQFTQAAREYAVPNDIAFLDLQYFFGSPDNNGAAYAASNTNRPWYHGDLVHPATATGGRVIADAVLRLITQL